MRVSRRHLFFVVTAILAVAAVIVVGYGPIARTNASGPSKGSSELATVLAATAAPAAQEEETATSTTICTHPVNRDDNNLNRDDNNAIGQCFDYVHDGVHHYNSASRPSTCHRYDEHYDELNDHGAGQAVPCAPTSATPTGP